MKKSFFTGFFALVLLAFTACEKKQSSQGDLLDNQCVFQPFSKRLHKVIKTNTYPGTSFPPYVRTTEYFFDDQGRVDSMLNDQTASAVSYDLDGRVSQLRHYAYQQPQTLTGVTTYYYNNGLLVKTVENHPGSPTSWSLSWFYEWDANGFIVKTWTENGNDKRVFTRDECGNVLKTQDFYNDTNAEHFLSEATYDPTPNPRYLIGLDAILPGSYSVNNPNYSRIIHWDCSDYDGSPNFSEYEYDAEGLPVKMTNSYGTEEYFYE